MTCEHLPPGKLHAIQMARYAWKQHLKHMTEGGNMGQLIASKAEVYSGVEDLVSVDIIERVFLKRMTSRVRTAVIKGLKSGVMSSWGGRGGFIYKLLCKQYNIPACSVNAGDVQLAEYYSYETVNRINATHVLSGGPKINARHYRSLYQSPITRDCIMGHIKLEYAKFGDEVACALRDIEDNAVLEFNTTITR